ncbi:hypothetical protein E2C01_047766 [Portunus trituberculatus]|uniref:Uncharacterized protein n=1 Tax=Portunus trituberculatus TaxID=210409 RepID=A0A5B7G9E0_PORTR|nr:hypothetical protein [Portunus trituberculatus]
MLSAILSSEQQISNKSPPHLQEGTVGGNETAPCHAGEGVSGETRVRSCNSLNPNRVQVISLHEAEARLKKEREAQKEQVRVTLPVPQRHHRYLISHVDKAMKSLLRDHSNVYVTVSQCRPSTRSRRHMSLWKATGNRWRLCRKQLPRIAGNRGPAQGEARHVQEWAGDARRAARSPTSVDCAQWGK